MMTIYTVEVNERAAAAFNFPGTLEQAVQSISQLGPLSPLMQHGGLNGGPLFDDDDHVYVREAKPEERVDWEEARIVSERQHPGGFTEGLPLVIVRLGGNDEGVHELQ